MSQALPGSRTPVSGVFGASRLEIFWYVLLQRSKPIFSSAMTGRGCPTFVALGARGWSASPSC